MGQIQNYKKKNSFNYMLLDIEDIELSTFEINCEIEYKRTIPLNMFEKYSIRLIEKAYELYSEINSEKISNLLHLDKNLIKENLENLEAIGMLNNINSDNITVNRAKNAEYLRYENKFLIETLVQNYHLTQSEYSDTESYIQKEFKRDKRNKNKKFKSVIILDNKESTKNANLLNFSDNQFLIFSKNGINSDSDLKFIDEKNITQNIKNKEIVENIFCNYNEFLAILRDKLKNKNDVIAIIGSKNIEKNHLSILPSNGESDIYILSNDTTEHTRVFNIEYDDFAWIGDTFYKREDNFIIESKEKKPKEEIKIKLEEYFKNKIIDIEPDYYSDNNKNREQKITSLENQLHRFTFQSKKEFDTEIKRVNTEKNKLYGLTNKNAQTRSKARQKIDKLENEYNNKELEKYQEYLQNKDKILEFKFIVRMLEQESKEMISLNQSLNQLKSTQSKVLSKENKQKIILLEKELKNLKRLKYEKPYQ